MATSQECDFLGVQELADALGVPVRTVYAWRNKRLGPTGVRFGRHLKFRRSDVEAWIEQQYEDAS